MRLCFLLSIFSLINTNQINADEGNLNFASISWKKNSALGPYAVDFTIKSIWNRNYENIIYCGAKICQPGVDSPSSITRMTLLGGQDGTPRFKFLESTRVQYPLTLNVANLSKPDDPRNWIAGYIQLSNNYSGPGPWQVEFSGCCLSKSPQQPFSLVATVDLHDTDSSPSIAVLPSISVPASQSFWVSALNMAKTSLQSLSWTLGQVVTYSGGLGGITLNSTTGLLSIPAGVNGSGYLTVRVSVGSASSPVLFALDAGLAAVSPFTSASPAAQSQIFGSAAGFNLAYTGYTGFPLQVPPSYQQCLNS
jgi:hypothetical protein